MDWDDAYAIMSHIPGADALPARWASEAETYRAQIGSRWKRLTYGSGERNWCDLIMPEGEPKGLAVFVHGGYWMKLDAGFWSHLAHGALARGWAVGLPTYTLCPEAKISEITSEIRTSIGFLAGQVVRDHPLSSEVCRCCNIA